MFFIGTPEINNSPKRENLHLAGITMHLVKLAVQKTKHQMPGHHMQVLAVSRTPAF